MLTITGDTELKRYCPFCYRLMVRDKEDETKNTCIKCDATFWDRDLSEEEVKEIFNLKKDE